MPVLPVEANDIFYTRAALFHPSDVMGDWVQGQMLSLA
jgi:hypothetical protein